MLIGEFLRWRGGTNLEAADPEKGRGLTHFSGSGVHLGRLPGEQRLCGLGLRYKLGA